MGTMTNSHTYDYSELVWHPVPFMHHASDKENNYHCQFTISLFFTLHSQAFSFFSLFLFIGMTGYFFVARYMLKWSTHGEAGSSHSAGAGTSSQDAADGPDD